MIRSGRGGNGKRNGISLLWYHFYGQKIASGKYVEENTKDKENTKDEKTVAMKGSIWKKKKKIVLFLSDPASITNILSSFTDLKFHGSCQPKNFIASTPS